MILTPWFHVGYNLLADIGIDEKPADCRNYNGNQLAFCGFLLFFRIFRLIFSRFPWRIQCRLHDPPRRHNQKVFGNSFGKSFVFFQKLFLLFVLGGEHVPERYHILAVAFVAAPAMK